VERHKAQKIGERQKDKGERMKTEFRSQESGKNVGG
jgi:hypothetical protein